MLIGVPKEVKDNEFRVGLVPASVRELSSHGHSVIIQSGAGEGICCSDKDYRLAGGTIVESASKVFNQAEMIVKVKEPQAEELGMLKEQQILFTYLHLAPDPVQANGLLKSGCTAIAYESVTNTAGALPLLTPMSEVAGRLSIQTGAYFLQKQQGGRGVLLGGVPGVSRGRVVIIGGGVVGINALRMAIGLETHVTIIDRSLNRLNQLDLMFGSRIDTVFSTKDAIEESILQADLVIGAVLVPGHSAPKLVTRKQVSQMQAGAVIIDVAIDQGGCFETSKPTTHSNPTYIVDDVVHYCVTNMPGAVPRTASFALNNATLPFVLALANKGLLKAVTDDPHLRDGLTVHKGCLTQRAVADDLKLNYIPAEEIL